jgi:hypothetical protein
MKKLTAILCLSALATGVFAQGTITVANGTYSLFHTNATGSAGTAGNTSAGLGGFYYAVFTAASTTTTIDTSLQNLLTSAWTFTGIYATNTAVASGGRMNGGVGAVTSQGWAPGTTNSYLLLGWSANVAGEDVNSILNEIRGATLSGGAWSGGGFATNGAAGGGFVGATAIGFGEAGGGTTGLGAFGLFGTTPTPAGTPIGTPTDLFVVSVPEPGTFALAGLGAAALLIFRRRK